MIGWAVVGQIGNLSCVCAALGRVGTRPTFAETHEVTSEARDLTSDAHEVTSEARDLTSDVHEVTLEAREVTSDAHEVTSEAHSVAQTILRPS